MIWLSDFVRQKWWYESDLCCSSTTFDSENSSYLFDIVHNEAPQQYWQSTCSENSRVDSNSFWSTSKQDNQLIHFTIDNMPNLQNILPAWFIDHKNFTTIQLIILCLASINFIFAVGKMATIPATVISTSSGLHTCLIIVVRGDSSR